MVSASSARSTSDSPSEETSSWLYLMEELGREDAGVERGLDKDDGGRVCDGGLEDGGSKTIDPDAWRRVIRIVPIVITFVRKKHVKVNDALPFDSSNS